MSDAEIYAVLNTVFRQVFDEDDLVVRADMTADDVDDWDSLTHVQLILATSRAFGVTFSAAEIGGMKTVGDLVASIRAKTAPTRSAASA